MEHKKSNLVCEHEWVEYLDREIYNDGINCYVEICEKCGAQHDISNKYAGIHKLKWYENSLLIPLFLVLILYIAIAPIIMIIIDALTPKRNAG